MPIVGLWGKKWGHEMIDLFLESNIQVVDFKASSKFDPKAIFSLYNYLANNSIDILHTHLFLMHVIGRITGRIAGIPKLVATHHNLRQSNNIIMRFFERVTASWSDVTTSVSMAAQESFFSTSEYFSVEALCSGRSRFTIYNSVDTDEIQREIGNVKISEVRHELDLQDEFVLACVGRLHPSKGHKYLVEASEHLYKTHPEVRILVVGDGPLEKILVKEVHARGLGDYIKFLGYREDVYRILAACNALVQPSIFEGFGLAAAEAMACGIPVVSTNLPSIAEVVQHKMTGLLVSPRDSRALAEAMAAFADNPGLVATFGKNGKKRVEEKFSSQVITRQYEALYKTLIERPCEN